MTRLALAFLCSVALSGLQGSAWGQGPQESGPAGVESRQAEQPPPLSELNLDTLFERLAGSKPTPAGKAVENEIIKRFAQSGSDTTDLLMNWAMQAVEEKNYPMALDILDQVLVLKPDFAEAWNKRATVNFLREDYAGSLSDIRETLALEPRHFGALSGLGIILEETGKKEEALAVFRRALAIDPLLDKVRETLERLEADTAGNSI